MCAPENARLTTYNNRLSPQSEQTATFEHRSDVTMPGGSRDNSGSSEFCINYKVEEKRIAVRPIDLQLNNQGSNGQGHQRYM